MPNRDRHLDSTHHVARMPDRSLAVAARFGGRPASTYRVAHMPLRFLIASAALASILLGAPADGFAANAIPVRIIDGQVCARGTIAGERIAIPANVVIDLGSRAPALVHENTAKLLGLARHAPVTFRLGDVTLADIPAVPAGIRALEELTQEFAAELGELPAVAVLGLQAFAGYTPQLDLPAGVVRLLPGAESAEVASLFGGDQPNSPEFAVLPFVEEGYGVWLTGTGPDAFSMRVQFSNSVRDTIIDATVTDLLGATGGELDDVRLGPINIARYVALRPQDLTETPEPHPDLVLGSNLLAHFRVTVDPAGQRMLFEAVRPPAFPQVERTFYVARAEEDADAIQALLPDRLPPRLANEAAELLVSYRLAEYPVDRTAFKQAALLKVQVDRPERRAATMVMLADHLLAGSLPDRLDLASDALAIGEPHAADDLNARAAHDIHTRLGLIALERNDLTAARRHLLSATFGLPRDPQVHLALGHFYERSGKYARAWSRYAQAAISNDPPVEAFQGLDRLNHMPELRESFTMADAEQILEGRVIEFHPVQRWTEQAGQSPPPLHLVELFSCIDHPPTLGAELAFGGLAEYFEGTEVVLLEYHVPTPALDPLATEFGSARAAYYGLESPPLALFDGGHAVATGGDDAAAEPLFTAYIAASRATITTDAPATSAPWHIEGDFKFSGDRMSGRVVVHGPMADKPTQLVLLLCERLVMAPGGNGLVLHRNVVRRQLSPKAGDTIASPAGERTFDISIDWSEIRAALENALAKMEQEHDVAFHMKPTYVDPRMCFVAAIVQQPDARQVLAARRFELTGAPDDE